jgi:hypothetical protein
LHGTGGEWNGGHADGDRRQPRGKGGAQSRRDGRHGFYGRGPACATSSHARRCLGARGALVGAPGGEAGDGPPVGAQTARTGRSKGGGVHGLQGHLDVRVAWGRSGAVTP